MVLDLRIPLTKRYEQDVLDTAVVAVPRRRARCRRHRAGHRRWLERHHRRGQARTSSSLPTSPALASSASRRPEPAEPVPRGRLSRRPRAGRPNARRVAFRRRGQMAVHLAHRPPHPRPLALPARRVGRPVALAARLPPGRRRPQVHRVRELPAAPVRPRAQPLPGRPEAAQRRSAGRSSSARRSCWSTIAWTRAVRGGRYGPFGLVLRLFAGVLLVGFVWLLVQALLSDGGRPGRADRDADLRVRRDRAPVRARASGSRCSPSSRCPWRRFFRVVFLIPLTITPVGVGYMFLMMTDTSKGPLEPLWVAARAAELHLGHRPVAGPRAP